ISGGFVEIGHHVPTKNGQSEVVWEPVLKLLTKTGDTWSWKYNNDKHQYTVVKFQESMGRTSVVIKETVTRNDDPDHPSEIRHVYVQDLGEIERQEWIQITTKEKKVVSEKKLVEENARVPRRDFTGP